MRPGLHTAGRPILRRRSLTLWWPLYRVEGAVKAAMAGAGIGLMAMDRDLGRLLQAGTTMIGQTSVVWEGGKPVDVPVALKPATERVRPEDEAARLPRSASYGVRRR